MLSSVRIFIHALTTGLITVRFFMYRLQTVFRLLETLSGLCSTEFDVEPQGLVLRDFLSSVSSSFLRFSSTLLRLVLLCFDLAKFVDSIADNSRCHASIVVEALRFSLPLLIESLTIRSETAMLRQQGSHLPRKVGSFNFQLLRFGIQPLRFRIGFRLAVRVVRLQFPQLISRSTRGLTPQVE